MKKIDVSTLKYPNVFSIVDDNAPDDVFKYKWGINNYGYARRNDHGKIVLLHRFLMGYSNKKLVIDHINQNKLDNRKCNLRLVNKSLNYFNSKLPKNNKSGTRGVSWSNSAKKWLSRIEFNGKIIHLGLFIDIENAIDERKKFEEKVGIKL